MMLMFRKGREEVYPRTQEARHRGELFERVRAATSRSSRHERLWPRAADCAMGDENDSASCSTSREDREALVVGICQG
jgi:hypothetical protein